MTLPRSIIIRAVEALAKRSPSSICVGYLYIRYSDHSKATVRDYLEVLVKQTIERHSRCLPMFNKVYGPHIREGTRPSEGELAHLLKRFVRSMAITFFFLDALDEAPTEIQLTLVKALVSLGAKVLITSRPLKALQAHFPDIHCFSIVAHEKDLDLHISKEISSSVELQAALDEAGPEWRGKVTSWIKKKCGGM
jgi:hypothetical protein